jgi:hypothetical protein
MCEKNFYQDWLDAKALAMSDETLPLEVRQSATVGLVGRIMSDIAESRGINVYIISTSLAKEVFTKMATRTYRVQVAGNGRVNVSSWGLATDVQDSYDCVDALPHWMQRKIAVLMIFDPEKVNEEIKGVGRRISKGTFWLYPEEGEDDGDDARAPREDAGA